MDRPLEIAFHNTEPSAAVEAEIRRHVDRLSTRYPHLTGCRVSVEALHQKHQHGNIFDVHVMMAVPGKELAVSHGPHHARERHAKPDVMASVRDAFKAAERQLLSFKERLSDEVATPNGSAVTGHVTEIEPGADHGFLLTNLGTQLYFHRDSVTNGRFEALCAGDAVHYVQEEGDAGPVAAKVRVVSG